MRALSLPKLTGSGFIPFKLFDNLQETRELKVKLFNPLKAERVGMQTRAREDGWTCNFCSDVGIKYDEICSWWRQSIKRQKNEKRRKYESLEKFPLKEG